MVKKFVSIFFLSCCIINASAQFVFDNCNTQPVFGDSLVGSLFIYDTTGIGPGSSGANQVWDYTAMSNTSAWPISHSYFDPALTEGYYMFPDANLADKSGSSLYIYSTRMQDSTVFLGDYLDSINFHNSWDPLKELVCPLSFGQSFTDFFSRYNFSNCPYHHTYTDRIITYDAYGTLKLPGGTYFAARLKTVENTLDTAICVGPSIISYWVDTTYLWFDVNTKQPVFSWHYFNDFTNVYKNIIVQEYSYSHVPVMVLAGVPSGLDMNSAISGYPNPTNGKFSVRRSGSGMISDELKIYNSIGNAVPFVLEGDSSVDLSSQPDGIYFLTINSTAGYFSYRVIVSK